MKKNTENKGKYVAYYRVSTEKQGASGLGLEAQQKAVMDYLNGGQWELISEFTEVESGRKSDRPELIAAMNECKAEKATLIIAKLDRLARDVHFISGLMQAGVDFVAVDMPHANKFLLHIMAAFAEHERDMISERTKAGLERARARGVELGTYGKVLAATNKKNAEIFAGQMAPVISDLRNQGVVSVREITEALNDHGIPGANGGRWHVATVNSLLSRIDGPRRRAKSKVTTTKARTKAKAKELRPVIKELEKNGITSLRGIAAALNERGIESLRGGRWHPGTVRNMLGASTR